jgi:hypothetical protein
MTSMLTPVLALIVWTFVVWLWMYATRLPAMRKAGIAPQAARAAGALDGLPIGVRQVSDNFRNLMEQPTVFYALCFYTYLTAHVTPTTIGLAWAYVGLRILHSLVQCAANIVVLRFSVYVVGTGVLAWLTALQVMALTGS